MCSSLHLLVGAVGVEAGSVPARAQSALVDVLRAVGPGETRGTGALVVVVERAALGVVQARQRGAVVHPFTEFACKSKATVKLINQAPRKRDIIGQRSLNNR